jgi:hypothetical protein
LVKTQEVMVPELEEVMVPELEQSMAMRWAQASEGWMGDQ